ncbi:uncharacterized protein LOC132257497 [Phlebotomus argentipes]|uniref:uncharacterized protein LOC132257497 n=1 Tax=Phlebotomus argentipes TaxID=94469 RepID=UPI00289366F3|nr:uncharacterized protein LOC132257497 [Phlebotomus argentipes]
MHKPLKRFTQCGSLTMIFAVFIVLFGVSSTALTTFGKPNQNQNIPQPPTPPPVRAKECKTHPDCSVLTNTSCVKDYYDDRFRCLCGDYTAPVNGFCQAKFKGLRHMCADTNQCDEGMLCAVENSTKTTALGSKVPTSAGDQQKVCLCDEDAGYSESPRNNNCSGAITIFAGVIVPLISLVIGSLMARKPLQ